MDAIAEGPGTVITAEHEGRVVEVLRDAAARAGPLRIRGGGTWLDAGRPVEAAATLDVSGIRGIVEYVPGDLTLTARAGTTIDAIDDATRRHGQWLPLDAPAAPAATLGATIATASSGPLAASIGLPRDVALGVTFVAGDARVVHGGGRVVKNVAGYDLVRLTTGAWGTTGVIVEVTVRLRARPDADVTLALPLPDETAALASLLSRLRAAPIEPLATQLLSAPLARAVGTSDAEMLLVRIAGNAASVRAQRAELARLGPVHDAPDGCWATLRRTEPASPCVFRLSSLPTNLPTLWRTALALARTSGGVVSATLERGVVRCGLGGAADDGLAARLEDVLPGTGGHCVFERLPAAWWGRLAPMAGGDRLSSGIRRAFDPHRLLNPGILGGTMHDA